MEWLWESFTQYYFLDWLALITSFLSVYLIGEKKKVGFFFGIIAHSSWLSFNVLVDTMPGIVANFFLILLQIKGLYQWNRAEKQRNINTPSE